VRPTEARLARWNEFDLQAGIWTIPASRMKRRKDDAEGHVVPLSEQALALLREM
jgi:integrase